MKRVCLFLFSMCIWISPVTADGEKLCSINSLADAHSAVEDDLSNGEGSRRGAELAVVHGSEEISLECKPAQILNPARPSVFASLEAFEHAADDKELISWLTLEAIAYRNWLYAFPTSLDLPPETE